MRRNRRTKDSCRPNIPGGTWIPLQEPIRSCEPCSNRSRRLLHYKPDSSSCTPRPPQCSPCRFPDLRNIRRKCSTRGWLPECCLSQRQPRDRGIPLHACRHNPNSRCHVPALKPESRRSGRTRRGTRKHRGKPVISERCCRFPSPYSNPAFADNLLLSSRASPARAY